MRRENRQKAAGGDGNWKDKLTAYDGKGITYNAIGNPLSYDGWSYTWEGRRLMGMSRSGGGNGGSGGSYGSLSLNAAAMTLSHTQGTQDAGDTFSVDQTGNLTVSTDKAPGSYFLAEGVLKAEEAGGSAQAVSYQYNAKGLRVSKTVDGVTTQYTLHGKLITHLKKGTDELHFFYDAQGKPAMVEFNGSYYAYVHTLQGDIGAIVDNTGTKVVEYGYDAWGKPTKVWSLPHPSDSTLTSAYAKLAQLNPFRYRGYVWDEETELYYLRSRYYDPAWGRFLNMDSIIAKGLLGHNVFLYCKNRPVTHSDTSGKSDRSILDQIGDWLSDLANLQLSAQMYAYSADMRLLKNVAKSVLSKFGDHTYGVQLTLTGQFGAAGQFSPIGLVIDTQGNYGVIISGGFGGGSPAGSASVVFSMTNAPDIHKLNGLAAQVGASGAMILDIGGDYITFSDAETGEIYMGGSIASGVSFPVGLEFHGLVTMSAVQVEGNLFEDMENIATELESMASIVYPY